MWHHARLLRRVLLVSSVLALSGLHIPGASSPTIWRAVRLTPLAVVLTIFSANIAATLTASDAFGFLNGIQVGISIAHALFSLAYLQRHRAPLHGLLRRARLLEEGTALCRQVGDHAQYQRSVGIIAILSGLTSVVWTASSFVGAELQHPDYMLPIFVPAALRTQTGYWVLVGMQAATCTVCWTMQAVFDLVQIGLMDAVAVMLDRLSRYGQRFITEEREVGTSEQPKRIPRGACNEDVGRGHIAGHQVLVRPLQNVLETSDSAFAGRHSQIVKDDHLSYKISVTVPMNINPTDSAAKSIFPTAALPGYLISPRAQDGLSASRHSPAAAGPDLTLTDPGADLESAIRQLTRAHRQVRALASEAAALCSPPTFTQHASIIVQLMVGLYVTIGLFLDSDSNKVLKTGMVFYLTATVLKLAAVSACGSRLAGSSGHLADTLTDTSCSLRHLSPPLRFTLQMLIEQARRPPEFTGCGFFVTQKTTMLSLLSFVLTYFIIMVQLKV